MTASKTKQLCGAIVDKTHLVKNMCLLEALLAEKRIAAPLTRAIISGPRLVGGRSL